MFDPHHEQPVLSIGQPLDSAQAAMILVHGRGASAQSLLPLAQELTHPVFTYLVPQAQNGTWYPYPFTEPTERNEPYLSSALQRLADIVTHIESANIPADRIVIGGFSQGACLAAEFVARNPRRWGGLFVLSGGLIGATLRTYTGALDGTPVFIGCSDIDAHVPLQRVHDTTAVFETLGAQVTEKIYPQMGHTVNEDELTHLRELINLVIPK
jgi:predicted esterase